MRLSSRGSIRSRSKARSIRCEVLCRGTSFGRVTSASMSTAVTHRLDLLHVEVDGARWHTPRGAVTEVSNKAPEVLSHCPVDNLYAHPEILDLLPDNTKRDGWHRHNTDQWAVDCFEHAVASATVAATVATVAYGASSRLCLCGRGP